MYFLKTYLLIVLSVWMGHSGITTAAENPESHDNTPLTNPQVHAFYYLWYGNPASDGRWLHWNHSILSHWDPRIDERYPSGLSFRPPHDIHSVHYPARGLYSSSNTSLLKEHFRDMRQHGIGVAVVSWWGRPGVSSGDSQNSNTDRLMRRVLKASAAARLPIAFHLEPYPGRNITSIAEDIKYIYKKYIGYMDTTNVYRLPVRRQTIMQADVDASTRPKEEITQSNSMQPVFYIYDSYHIPYSDWEQLLKPAGNMSVRGTQFDGVFVGLWLGKEDGKQMLQSGFDGAYTYFATEGYTWGTTLANWKRMVHFTKKHNMFFAPCVSPGYDDTRIRPWNAVNRRDRGTGEYYKTMWNAALEANAAYVGITTYNEWGEGTQIEAAVPRELDVDSLSASGLAFNRTLRSQLGLYAAYFPYHDHPNYYLEETLRYSIALANKIGYSSVATDLEKNLKQMQRDRPPVYSLPDIDETKEDDSVNLMQEAEVDASGESTAPGQSAR